MDPAHTHTPYHPRWYRPRMSTYWWLFKAAYLKFILRESSSVFVGYFVAVTLAQIYSLTRGAESYAKFEAWMKTPLALTLNIIALFFVLFHAVTWFNLAPKAMVVKMGGKRVPGALIALSNYGLWAVVSLFVFWILTRG